MYNKHGYVPALAVLAIVILIIFILATANPSLKQTIIEILTAFRGG